MNPDLAIDLFKSTVMFALYIVAPFLGVTLVVVIASFLGGPEMSPGYLV